MRNLLISAAVLVLLGMNIVPAQSRRPSQPIKKKPAASTPVKRVPPYHLNLRIGEDSQLYLSVVSDGYDRNLEPGHLNALITDLPAGADSFHIANTAFPKVVIEPNPKLSMLGLWNPITLFRRDRTDISVVLDFPAERDQRLSERLTLIVPWDSEDTSSGWKPDPLRLFVEVRENGELTLNEEPNGTLSEPTALIRRLASVFKEREDNGVLRAASNEIEKTVMIVMPMGERKVSDLAILARAVRYAGCDQIELAMENPIPKIADFDETLLPRVIPASKGKRKP